MPTLPDPLGVVAQVLGAGRVEPEHGPEDAAEADLALDEGVGGGEGGVGGGGEGGWGGK